MSKVGSSVAALIFVATGAVNAFGHSAAQASGVVPVHSNQAVWMTIQTPDGNVSTALTYDDTMATVSCEAPACPSVRGWGFLPSIQSDGSVSVKVFKLTFAKQGQSYVVQPDAQYIETINPNPMAGTTKSADANIVVHIVKTGPADTLKAEFKQAKTAEHAAYLHAHGDVQGRLLARNGSPPKLIVAADDDCCSVCADGHETCARVWACCSDGYCCYAP